MSDFLTGSAFFGMALSFVVYLAFHIMREKLKIKNPLFNPLLLASALIICFLLVTKIDYDTFNSGAKYLTYWLTPLTICLAIPLYRRLTELKNNLAAVIIGILSGVIGHVLILAVIAVVAKLNPVLLHSVMPKSVTTAIALSLSEKLGGVASVTVVGVTIAGMTGVVLGPSILKLCKVTEPVAQGLAMGTASHAVGTSKAMELGEVQGAMSSLAIVVTGILTVVVVPIVASLIG